MRIQECRLMVGDVQTNKGHAPLHNCRSTAAVSPHTSCRCRIYLCPHSNAYSNNLWYRQSVQYIIAWI